MLAYTNKDHVELGELVSSTSCAVLYCATRLNIQPILLGLHGHSHLKHIRLTPDWCNKIILLSRCLPNQESSLSLLVILLYIIIYIYTCIYISESVVLCPSDWSEQ